MTKLCEKKPQLKNLRSKDSIWLDQLYGGPNGTSTNLQASVKRKISTQTSNYTITENDDIILADSSSAAFVLSLPDVADVPEGKSYTIKKTNEDFNSIEIDPFNPFTN